MKAWFRKLWKDEKGEFGIKQIAGTVAVIVIIGLVVGIVEGSLATWVSDVWDLFFDEIKEMTT